MPVQNVFAQSTAGYIVTINDVPVFFPTIQGAPHSFLHNDGTGVWSWQLAVMPVDSHAIMRHEESVIISGAPLTVTADANQQDGYYANSPRATFTNLFYVTAGTYTLSILGRTTLLSGIVDWYIDDVLIAAGQDWYGANTYNVVKTITGLVLTTGQHELKCVSNGSSGSGYNLYLTKMWVTLDAVGATWPLYQNENNLSFSDILINNANTTQHGFMPKAVAPAAGTLNYYGINNGETLAAVKSASSNPGAAAAILQTDASGGITISPWSLLAAAGTRSSGTVFSVAADMTALITKGTKLKLTDTTTKYFYVLSATYSAPNTTITITGGADYTLVGNPSNVYFSNLEAVQGFPMWFNWTPTFTGFSADPTGLVHRFSLTGSTCHVVGRMLTNGTSNDTVFTETLPIAAATITNAVWRQLVTYADNSISSANPGLAQITSAGTTISFFTTLGGGTWTATGGKRVIAFNFDYEI